MKINQYKVVTEFFVDKKYGWFWNIIFYAAIFVTIVLFVYKADYTGTTYDESLTSIRFCDSIYTARHTYDTPNNHVLNSIFILFSSSLFGFYEQYIRIFPMLSGMVFFAGIAYLVKKLITLPTVQTATLLLIFYIPYTFNFLFMARGYTYGLSGAVLYIVLVFYLYDHPIRFRFWPIPVVLLSLINFYVLGSMLSGVYILFCLNGLFVLLFAHRIYKDRTGWWLPAVLNGITIASLSGIMVYLFYRPVLPQVMDIYNSPLLKSTIEAWKGWISFIEFYDRLLLRQIYDLQTIGMYLFGLCLFILIVSLFVYAVKWIKALRQKYSRTLLGNDRKANYLLFTVLMYVVILFVIGGVLGHCPGLVRSHVVLVPLVCLVFVWLAEGLLKNLRSGKLQTICVMAVWLLIVVTALHKTPYLHSVGGRGMAMSKPTLRRLKALDPEMTWNIVFSRSMYTYAMEFRYYEQFDTYKFNLNAPNYNVLICRPQDKPEKGFCLDYEYFLEQNECYVYLTINPNWQKMMLELKPVIQD